MHQDASFILSTANLGSFKLRRIEADGVLEYDGPLSGKLCLLILNPPCSTLAEKAFGWAVLTDENHYKPNFACR
ncbi:hypothetical protein RSAG8_05249, partial [Rhizoctonia solani AG-8 WAC10335]